MGSVSNIQDKQEKDVCQFCGQEPDHKGFWQCPRLRSVAYYPAEQAWEVEFVDPPLEEEHGIEESDGSAEEAST